MGSFDVRRAQMFGDIQRLHELNRISGPQSPGPRSSGSPGPGHATCGSRFASVPAAPTAITTTTTHAAAPRTQAPLMARGPAPVRSTQLLRPSRANSFTALRAWSIAMHARLRLPACTLDREARHTVPRHAIFSRDAEVW